MWWRWWSHHAPPRDAVRWRVAGRAFPRLLLTLLCCRFAPISHVFGLKANVKDNVHFADENVVIYPAGHNVVKFFMDTKLQEFINGSDLEHSADKLDGGKQ